jgi:predicted Fe-S protein YdhL (DUF1289 family)
MLESCVVKHGHEYSDGLNLTKQESRKWQTFPPSYRDEILNNLNSRVTQRLWVGKNCVFIFVIGVKILHAHNLKIST